MLEDSLRWRKKNNMDGILDEDWSDYEARFKTDTDGVDKLGRPIYYVQLGSWDLRQAVLAGEIDKVSRYLMKGIEKMVGDVRKLQAEGKNVTQYIFIADIGGFSVTQHGCLACIPVYVTFVAWYELYYPGMASRIILVNSPSIFEVVLNAIRPVFSPRSRDVMTVFGSNKQRYASTLFDEIDRNQLLPEVGGTKEEHAF